MVRSLLAAVVALVVGAAVPPIVGLLYASYVGSTPPPEEGQYLTAEESLILLYFASLFIGGVVGLPSFFLLRRAGLSNALRLTLSAVILGTVSAVLLWFGTGARQYSVLWVYPIAASAVLVFGGVWRLLSRPVKPV
jgi:hypothetical protein